MVKDLEEYLALKRLAQSESPRLPPAQHKTVEQFIRLKQFIALMGWSRSTYYNRVAAGLVPPARSNGPRTRGYYAGDVAAIQAALTKAPTLTPSDSPSLPQQ